MESAQIDETVRRKFSDAFICSALQAFEQGKFVLPFFYAGFLLHGEFRCERIQFETDRKVLHIMIPDPRGNRGKRKREPNRNLSKFVLVIENGDILRTVYRALSLLLHNLKICKSCNSFALYTSTEERQNFKLAFPSCCLDTNCFCYLYIEREEGESDDECCNRCRQYRTVAINGEASCVVCTNEFGDQSAVALQKGCSQCKTLICTICFHDPKLPKKWKTQCQTCKKEFYADLE